MNNNSKSDDYIPGGYYIKARRIQESLIAHSSPATREIWDWLLMRVNHSENRSSGRLIRRGQTVCRYEDIIEGLHWFRGYCKERYTKDQCENALKFLKREEMITTQKTTRGMVITITNYDYYQSPENYIQSSKTRQKAKRKRQTKDTINNNDNNVEEERSNVKQKNYKHTEDDWRLARLLVRLIKGRHSSWIMKDDIRDWAEDIQRLRQLDKRTPEQIEFMIKWTQQDDYWHKFILSTHQLRQQFNNIIPKIGDTYDVDMSNPF